MKLTGILVLICSIAFLAGCKKEDDISPARKKLLSGKWQITASEATMKYNGKDTTIDYYNTWRACEQDDFDIFTDDGKGTHNENSNKCPEDDQVGQFTWELQNNDTKLKLTTDHVMISDILELSDTRLKLKLIETDSIYGQVTYVETFKNIN